MRGKRREKMSGRREGEKYCVKKGRVLCIYRYSQA